MKQTAVEWLVNKLNNDFENNDFLISQAKELEKEQTLHFGAKCCLMTTQQNDWSLEELYNKTFNE